MRYDLISFCKSFTMNADTISQKLSEKLIVLWNAFETDEEFYQCTENGIDFNYLKCMERRVLTLGTSMLHSFESADEPQFKAILLKAFCQALNTINDDARKSDWFLYEENRRIHNAGIQTLTAVAEELLDRLD